MDWRITSKSIAAIFAILLFGAMMPAQDMTPAFRANPAPGCSTRAARRDANRRLVMEFFRASGEGKVTLLDPSYKQHNPVVVRRAQQDHLSDYEEAKKSFLEQANGPVQGLGLGPTPPGNRFEIVTAECDIVTVIHSGFRHDPTGLSKFYEAFTFDTFRVKNGKLIEHWDDASITAPLAAPPSPPTTN